jgi:hypothetical protein
MLYISGSVFLPSVHEAFAKPVDFDCKLFRAAMRATKQLTFMTYHGLHASINTRRSISSTNERDGSPGCLDQDVLM